MDLGTRQTPDDIAHLEWNPIGSQEAAGEAPGPPDLPEGLTIYERQEPSSTWALWLVLAFVAVLSIAALLASVNEGQRIDRLAGTAPQVIGEGADLMQGAVVSTSEASEGRGIATASSR